VAAKDCKCEQKFAIREDGKIIGYKCNNCNKKFLKKLEKN
jgi:hypothetical protein